MKLSDLQAEWNECSLHAKNGQREERSALYGYCAAALSPHIQQQERDEELIEKIAAELQLVAFTSECETGHIPEEQFNDYECEYCADILRARDLLEKARARLKS